MQGYEPHLSAAQGANPANILLGGIGLAASGTLTVTYRLTERAIAEHDDREQRYRIALNAYKKDLEHYRQRMVEWLQTCDTRRADHARVMAEWRQARAERAATMSTSPEATDD